MDGQAADPRAVDSSLCGEQQDMRHSRLTLGSVVIETHAGWEQTQEGLHCFVLFH